MNPNCERLCAICFSSIRKPARSRQSPMRNILSRKIVRSSVCSHTSITSSVSHSGFNQEHPLSQIIFHSSPPAPNPPPDLVIKGLCGTGTAKRTGNAVTAVSVGSFRLPTFPARIFCSIGFGGRPTDAIQTTYQPCTRSDGIGIPTREKSLVSRLRVDPRHRGRRSTCLRKKQGGVGWGRWGWVGWEVRRIGCLLRFLGLCSLPNGIRTVCWSARLRNCFTGLSVASTAVAGSVGREER